MPLTAAEWLSENSERQELAVMNIPLAMELYARYYHSELSRPPKDVEEAIEEKYPYSTAINDVSSATRRAHISEVQLQRLAALHGCSLAAGEIERLDEWIYEKELAYQDGDWYWKEDIDGDQPMSLKTLYSLFKKESNG